MRSVEVSKEQLKIIEKDHENERFVSIDGLIFDREGLTYYNDACDAYSNNPADTLNAIAKMLHETKMYLKEELVSLRKEIIDDLTPRGAHDRSNDRRW